MNRHFRNDEGVVMKQPKRFIAAALAAGAMQAVTASASELPGVDAGADQAVSLGGPVSLAGRVIDRAAPLASIGVGWSKVDGPGAVQFGQPHAAVTTATFSAPGKYTLMLGGYDGYVYYDFVEVTVNP
jgi:hypothetical protein